MIKSRKRLRKTLIILAGILALGIPLFVCALFFQNHIPFGISVGGISVGGLDLKQTEDALTQAWQRYEQQQLTLTHGGKIWKATARELGIRAHIQATVRTIHAIGKTNDVPRALREIMRALTTGIAMPLEITVDDPLFEAYFQKHLVSLEKKMRNAAVVYDAQQEQFQTLQENEGIVINKSMLKYDLLEHARMLKTDAIAFATALDKPLVTLVQAEQARRTANELLKRAPFSLEYRPPVDTPTRTTKNKESYTIEKNQLKDFITFIPSGNDLMIDVSEQEITNWIIQLAPSINEKPQNAVLTFEKGKVKEFMLSKGGIELDVNETVQRFKTMLLASPELTTADIAVAVIAPELRTETIENLGFTTLLAQGVSDFVGSPDSRVFNLKLGAKKLDGVIIKPGEEFSFLNAVGEIDAEQGYQPALVIKNRKVIPEYGGGVCQVSTTMFRAAILAGLKITERFPHSLPVAYYNPQGFDAAVYGPHPDLRFINDTPSNILVQTKTKGTKMYFDFYGTSDGREVKMIGPTEYDKKPDGSLKAKFTREIYKNNELATTEVFTSYYRSPQKDIIQKNPLE